MNACIQAEPEAGWVSKDYALRTFDNLPGQVAALCLEAAERVLPVYERVHPEDARPRLAVGAAQLWVRRGTIRYENLVSAVRSAEAARLEATLRQLNRVPAQQALVDAARSAEAVAQMAVALTEAGWIKRRAGFNGVGYSSNHAWIGWAKETCERAVWATSWEGDVQNHWNLWLRTLLARAELLLSFVPSIP